MIILATLIALWGGLIPLHRRHRDVPAEPDRPTGPAAG
jgi:hypothetical protein